MAEDMRGRVANLLYGIDRYAFVNCIILLFNL